VLLAAVMSKMGGYGMLRVLLPFFPEAAATAAPWVGVLAVIGVLVGAFGALSHTSGDLKRLVAYTSINHMGYVALAVAALAALPAGDTQSRAITMNGAVMQMVAHGLSTAALFVLAGSVYDRTGTYQLAALGGLRRSMPILAGVMGIAVFANLGLPGLAGFVGEFLILRGVWAAMPWLALVATVGLVVTALALLRMFGRIFHGPPAVRATAPDLTPFERDFVAVAPLLALLLALGIYPAPLLDLTNAVVSVLARTVSGS
jgi:NADH-quinone oxidoreductase subunit M